MPLLDGLGQVLDRAGVLAELGDGAVQARLAVGDQAFVVGPDLQRSLVARGEVQHAGEGGGGAQAQPDRDEGRDGRRGSLLGRAEHEAPDLSPGAHIEMPLRKQPLERSAQPRQAIHVDFGSPTKPGSGYEAKSKQWASALV